MSSEFMNYDLASNKMKYRGCERSLSCDDFAGCSRKRFKYLFEIYMNLFEEVVVPYADHIPEEGLEKLLYYYHTFKDDNVDCEIIVFDKKPIDESKLSYKIELLGIDIVDYYYESLLAGLDNYKTISKYLNDNMLCDTTDVIPYVLSRIELGGKEWGPCWVYKLKIDDSAV